MIHKVSVYKGSVLIDDAQSSAFDPESYYILVRVTTLGEAKTLAESLDDE